MRKGRKPLPTNLRVLNGNAGHRPLPKDEPKPPIVIPDPPRTLDERGREIWQEMAEQLKAMRLITKLDAQALLLYCETQRTWEKATDAIKETGLLVKGSKGQARINPLVQIQREAMRDCLRILTEFGMTPSSRTRVKEN